MQDHGIFQEIRELLALGKPSREVIEMGYAPGSVYKAQRQLRKRVGSTPSSSNALSEATGAPPDEPSTDRADVYLRRLGAVCLAHNITPSRLVKIRDRSLYNFLLDIVSEMEGEHAGGYIKSVVKAVKSWLAFNDKVVRRKIMIKGAEATPTLRDERVPTQDELRNILVACDPKTRVICALMAFSGLRPEVLGDYKGEDGLTIGDLPDTEIVGRQVTFRNIPAMIRVRPELSKTSHEYFTFLCQEGCDYLASYLQRRLKAGERLTAGSSIVTPRTAPKLFIRALNIGDAVRQSIRTAGFTWRPYVLRSYFATQLMLAESKGLVIRDYRTFFMGHKGDIESVYTLNKRTLPTDVVEQMRESYGKAQKYVQTMETSAEEDVTKGFKRQLLLVAGYKPEEIKDEQLDLGEEDFEILVRDRLVAGAPQNPARQKVIDERELGNVLADGWEFVSNLPTGKVVVKQLVLA